MDHQRLSLIWRIPIVFTAISIIWWISSGVNTWIGVEGEYSRTAHVLSALLIFSLVIPLIIVARKYLDKRPWTGLRLTSFKKGWKPFVYGGDQLSYTSIAGNNHFFLVWVDKGKLSSLFWRAVICCYSVVNTCIYV